MNNLLVRCIICRATSSEQFPPWRVIIIFSKYGRNLSTIAINHFLLSPNEFLKPEMEEYKKTSPFN